MKIHIKKSLLSRRKFEIQYKQCVSRNATRWKLNLAKVRAKNLVIRK